MAQDQQFTTCHRLCFAPKNQPHNRGSRRNQPFRTLPFENSGIWIGNLDDLSERVWPHPSYMELIARAETGSPRFPLPGIIEPQSIADLQNFQCGADGCFETPEDPFTSPKIPSDQALRLEKLPFWNQQRVLIYSFHVQYSKSVVKRFTIVHDEQDGEYRFWKAAGGYHDSYLLTEGRTPAGDLGRAHEADTERRTKDLRHNTTRSRVSGPRVLLRSRRSQGTLVDGLDEDPFEPPPKKRATAQRILSSSESSTKPIPCISSNKQRMDSATGRSLDQLLHVKKMSMLFYHLESEHLSLQYKAECFNVENGNGALIDPRKDTPFEMSKEHIDEIIVGSNSSNILVTSREHDEITGGTILIDFMDQATRDRFLFCVKSMFDGQSTRYNIVRVPDSIMHRMFDDKIDDLGRQRAIMTKDQQRSEISSTEQDIEENLARRATQLLPADAASEPETEISSRCPAAMDTAISEGDAQPRAHDNYNRPGAPISPIRLQSAALPPTPASLASPPVPLLNVHTESEMRQELLGFLREIYTKYPSAQDDDQVETFALQLKAPILNGDKERVRVLRMELKVYLIAHHGLAL